MHDATNRLVKSGSLKGRLCSYDPIGGPLHTSAKGDSKGLWFSAQASPSRSAIRAGTKKWLWLMDGLWPLAVG